MHHSDIEEPGDVATDTSYTVDERGVRKLLFKKRSTSSTCAVSCTYLALNCVYIIIKTNTCVALSKIYDTNKFVLVQIKDLRNTIGA